MRKYNFINMPVKEQWGVYAPEDSPLSKKKCVAPEDLKDMSIVAATGDFNQSRIGKQLGECKDQVEIVATVNLPYNEAVLAKEKIGVMLSINLNCTYENLYFIPINPILQVSTVLGWKKEQIFSATTTAFIEFATKYLKSISAIKYKHQSSLMFEFIIKMQSTFIVLALLERRFEMMLPHDLAAIGFNERKEIWP